MKIDPFQDYDTDGKILSQLILEKCNGKVKWTYMAPDRIN
jgi:hypothetical protein